MSTEKMREEFEAKFQIPFGVEWRDGEYHISKPGKKQITLAGHLFYLGRWESWQASRAAIEVELPSAYQNPKPYACYEGGWNDMRVEAVDNIESLGLKVKPC